MARESNRVHSGTHARSLLTTAVDEADPDPRDVTALLDRIDGAREGALAGLQEARAGQGIPLADVELLEALEDAIDLDAAREALADAANATPIPWDEVRARLQR